MSVPSPGTGEFVIWDVGLGAAANALSVIRACSRSRRKLHLISFDHTDAPLRFALENAHRLAYLHDFEPVLRQLLADHQVSFPCGDASFTWELLLADFPAFLNTPRAQTLPSPHGILFDPFSPAKNPVMWTQPLFARLFQLVAPNRACVMPTYSRSTMLRVTLLTAGWYVGCGSATGEKEETTVAATSRDLLTKPLDLKWLKRASVSHSAEPMYEPVYRQAPLTPETWKRLRQHPQFT